MTTRAPEAENCALKALIATVFLISNGVWLWASSFKMQSMYEPSEKLQSGKFLKTVAIVEVDLCIVIHDGKHDFEHIL